MMDFWLSIVSGKGSKLSKLLYTIMFHEQEKGVYDFIWIRCINDILVFVGRPDLFRNDSVNNPKSVKRGISRTLSDIYFQEWNEKVNISSKGKQYFLFKDNLNFEKYFINVSKFMLKLSNLGQAIIGFQLNLVIIGSQLKLEDGMTLH